MNVFGFNISLTSTAAKNGKKAQLSKWPKLLYSCIYKSHHEKAIVSELQILQ